LPVACLLFLSVPLFSSCEDDPAPPTDPTCQSSVWSSAYDVAKPSEVAVFLDLPAGDERDILERDVGETLGKLWGAAPRVVHGPPDGSARVALWISTSAEAQGSAGTDIADGHALRRSGGGDAITLLAYGTSDYHAAVGAYALLEVLGARFFHPLEDLIPALGEARIPTQLEVIREPAFVTRSVQLHTLHPIEYFDPVTVPGEENLALAKRFIDWLVKTGHNDTQWWALDEQAPGFEEHTTAIIDYAHMRGVTVGVLVQLSQQSNLQRAFGLVSEDATTEQGIAEVQSRLDELMTVPWDHVELALGEFLAADPVQLLSWLDTATEHLESRDPPVEAGTINHVGGELYVDHEGESVFFYHLPQFADPRLVNTVHTVFFFDLYRDWGGYGHDNFFDQRDYLFEHLGERVMRYSPESAYWATADIDVPLFLPTYLTGRWLDVNGIVNEPKELGLPPVDGHIMFSSGHEWGYWMTDYLTAKMLWSPDEPLASFVAHVASAFGSCAGEIETSLGALIEVQDRYLFDQRLVGYLSGEDLADDFGADAGFSTTPLRRPYQEVATLPAGEREAFEREVVDALDAFADEVEPIAAALAAACLRPDERSANFCSELVDGAEIVMLRARHSALLYRAVLTGASDKDAARKLLGRARAVRDQAEQVIARREKGYRFPLDKLVEPFENTTSYDYGYLRQAHLLCYWDRQAIQADVWIEYESFGWFGLPTCAD